MRRDQTMPNIDKHRYHYTAGIDALESEKAGREMAEKRYGPLSHRDGAAPPKDQSQVQAAGNASAAGVPSVRSNDSSGFVRGAGEDASRRPGYLKGYRGK
jgi:hypothetical protein